MLDISKMLDPIYLMGVLDERQDFSNTERENYIWNSLFPYKPVPQQIISWETQRHTNNLAGVYSSRGQAIPVDDVGFGTEFANLVWIKAAQTLDPAVLVKIRDAGKVPYYAAGDNGPYVIQDIRQRIEDEMRKKLAKIDDQMEAQKEYFAIQALQGQLVWPPRTEQGTPLPTQPHWNENQPIKINWPFTPEFIQSMDTLTGVPVKAGGPPATGGGYLWSDATQADPMRDIDVIAEMMLELKNVDLNGATMICSRRVLWQLARTDAIQQFYGISKTLGDPVEAHGAMYANNERIRETFNSRFGLNVRMYDARWSYFDGVDATGKDVIKSMRFLPSSKLIIIPRGENLGNMAVAPQETQSGEWVQGKTLWVNRKDTPPYDREMGLSEIVWPIMPQPDAIGVFTVL